MIEIPAGQLISEVLGTRITVTLANGATVEDELQGVSHILTAPGPVKETILRLRHIPGFDARRMDIPQGWWVVPSETPVQFVPPEVTA